MEDGGKDLQFIVPENWPKLWGTDINHPYCALSEFLTTESLSVIKWTLHKEGIPPNDRGRDQSDAATRQGMSKIKATTGSQKMQR